MSDDQTPFPRGFAEKIINEQNVRNMEAQARSYGIENFIDGLSVDDLRNLRNILIDTHTIGEIAIGAHIGRVETRLFDREPSACRACAEVHTGTSDHTPIVLVADDEEGEEG